MIERQRALAIQRRAIRDFIVFMARAEPRSRLVERDGVTAAVVPATAGRSLPNSVTYTDLGQLAESLDDLAATYRSAGIGAWTVWAPEFDREAIGVLEGAGHVFDGSPAAMVLELERFAAPDLDGLDYDIDGDLPTLGRFNDLAYGLADEARLSPSFARRPDGLDLRLYRAHLDGEVASVLGTIDHPPSEPGGGADCGIYFVATPPALRGRGLATRLLAAALVEARERGCATSSLQGSRMGEPLYAGLGYERCFRMHMYERRG